MPCFAVEDGSLAMVKDNAAAPQFHCSRNHEVGSGEGHAPGPESSVPTPRFEPICHLPNELGDDRVEFRLVDWPDTAVFLQPCCVSVGCGDGSSL